MINYLGIIEASMPAFQTFQQSLLSCAEEKRNLVQYLDQRDTRSCAMSSRLGSRPVEMMTVSEAAARFESITERMRAAVQQASDVFELV
jgi:hypothetical protein